MSRVETKTTEATLEIKKDDDDLRDEIAIAAMQGELASQGEEYDWCKKALAGLAYDVADAMMDERERRKKV